MSLITFIVVGDRLGPSLFGLLAALLATIVLIGPLLTASPEHVAVQRIARKPAQRESRRIRTPDNNRPRPAQIRHNRVVIERQKILLDPQSVSSWVTFLVHILLDSDRHPHHWPGFFTTGQ